MSHPGRASLPNSPRGVDGGDSRPWKGSPGGSASFPLIPVAAGNPG
jgi:hypothetical protein